ncbi:hypothetical protein AB0F36_13130 [Streptomyces sp. NPDC029080]|uniref:hypothetical protein n=1 Tax=Streptomyces sp. NPDC029080 TaxID=3155017 RepID=UPI003408F65D
MKSLTILGFVLSAVLIAMACVKADRVRAWRESLNPSAPEVPDAAFVLARILFLGMAAVGVYNGFQGIALSDGVAWSDDELTSAVSGATDALDGAVAYAGPHEGVPTDFDGDYAMTVADEVTSHGGGDAPGPGTVDAALTGPKAPEEAYYTITADGTPTTFCLHVKIKRDKSDDYQAPGIAGGSYPQYAYVHDVTSRRGEC